MFSSRAGDQVHHTVIHAAPSRSVSFCSASGPFEQQPSATNPLSAQTSTAVDCTEAPICASVSNWSPIFLSLSNLDETALRSNLLDSSQSHAPSSSNISAEHKSAANPCSRPVSGQAHVSESSSYAMCNSTASVSPTVISARKTAASSFAAVAGSGHFIRRTRSSYSRRRASLRSAAWPKPPPEVNCAPMQSVVLTKTQSLAIRVMPARVTQTSAPVSCSRAISRDVCVPTNSAISTKKRSHSTVSKELDETRARKSCEICFRSAASSKMSEEKKRGTLTISNCSKNYSSVFCSYCDDMYCVSCVTTNSDINAVRTDSSFICVQCVADCELKNSRPTVSKQTRVCRPSRDFSSVYLKSQAVSSSSVVAMSSALFRSSASTLPLRVISASWSILNEPPRPLVQDAALLARLAVLPASSLAFSSLLSGLSVSMLKKAHLKLPRYADRNPEQRAHARHQLAAALKEKGIFFDDDHSYPWDDCTEVH